MTEKQPRTTIMIVDDTPANLNLLTEMLQHLGYGVIAFPGGKMALRAAEKNPPDLILLDINMPEINGFEVCERLKANQKLKDIPVLFISALSDTADKVRAFDVGGVDYVNKPFQMEEVHARVKTHLKMRALQLDLIRHNTRLEELVREKVAEISNSQLSTINALARLTESRDDDTGAHIERTQFYCKILAQKLAENALYSATIDPVYIDNISLASSLHDIGKVGIRDSILLKPGKLTPQEFETMKTHTLIGASTLNSARLRYPYNAFLNMGLAIARSHHEKWDGSGYPDGLAGENIPLSARIMAVADVYDALRSVRPYKKAFSHEESAALIFEGSGSHFDPLIVEAFRAVQAEFAGICTRFQDTNQTDWFKDPAV